MITYVFTVTFKSMLCREKFKLIQNLPSFFLNHIDSGTRLITKPRSAFLTLAVEYHRRKKFQHIPARDVKHLKIMQNPTMPHVHGKLVCRKLPRHVEESILKDLRDTHGRSEFYIQEDDEEVEAWDQYCLKEVSANDDNYDFKHYLQEILPYGPQVPLYVESEDES